jgi:hypothetical protein
MIKIGGWEKPLKSEVDDSFAVHRDISIMPILLEPYHAVYSTYKAHNKITSVCELSTKPSTPSP